MNTSHWYAACLAPPYLPLSHHSLSLSLLHARLSCCAQHVAITSLFLATKSEETPCKLLDLFRAFDRCLHRRFSPPQRLAASPYPSLYLHSALFQHWRTVLASLELNVLAALGYSLYLLHPHRLLPHLLHLLVPPPHHLLPSLLSDSLSLLNSIHLYITPLVFPPLSLALGSIGLSLHRHHLPVPLDWITLLGGEEEEVVKAAWEMATLGEKLGDVEYVKVGVDGGDEDEVEQRKKEGQAQWAEQRRQEAEAAAKRLAEEEDERQMRELRRIAVQESLKSLRSA